MFHGPVYVTSDIHLGAIPEERAARFRKWLRHAGEAASAVVINGDLFDFWFEYSSVVPRGHTRTLGLLAEIVDSGTPVVMFGGNHDWWGGSFLREEIGVEFRQEPGTLELAGRRVLLAHGDGIGRGDLGYRALRLLLRGRVTRWAFRWLHPDLGAIIARRVSLTEAREPGNPGGANHRARELAEWAERRLAADPSLDLVVLGHTHVPVIQELFPGRFYANAGDWVHHSTYLVLEEGRPPDLREWPE